MTETGETARWLLAALTRRLEAAHGAAAHAVATTLRGLDLDGGRRPEPTWLPVLRHFAHCVGETMLLSPDLAAALAAAEDDLHWRQTEGHGQMGESFMANYGWCQIIGPHGFFADGDFLLGLLLIGPHQHYVDHAHAAPELYMPLTGGSEWSRGSGAFAAKPAGAVIWHDPHEVHSLRTNDAPLLALWCWTKDVGTPARLVTRDSPAAG